jgi:hypothetical protein
MLYGEISFEEEELVQSHLEGCATCRAELQRVRTLHRELERAQPDLPSGLLDDCRRDLRLAVASLPAPSAGQGWAQRWRAMIFPAGFSFPLAKLAGAAALLAIGFVGGQFVAGPVQGLGRMTPDAAPVASRVRYVQGADDGGVQIVVEEVRQRVLQGGVNDSRIRALLVAAAREANDPGVRVETVDLLKGSSDSAEVRRALLAALQQDSNPGVRLKALEALRTSAEDGEVRRVLARVLLSDDNPGVRTQAIDLLTQTREPALVGVLQELVAREDNNYVRLKCQRALSEMNASVETF